LAGVDWARYDPSDTQLRQSSVIRRAEENGSSANVHSANASGETAAAWSDRAAEQCTFGQRDDDALLLFRCWSAAERALDLDPALPAARFNRAIALDLLGIAPLARDAYKRFLDVDPVSGWAVEARDRLRRIPHESHAAEWQTTIPVLRAAALRGSLSEVATVVRRFPQQSRVWVEGIFLADWGEAELAGDEVAAKRQLDIARAVSRTLAAFSGETLASDAVAAIDEARSESDQERLDALARGHALYRRGRKAYADRLNAGAMDVLGTAHGEFKRGRSPMQLLAVYYQAAARFDAADHERSAEMIQQLDRDVPKSFPSLRAHLLWQQATASGRAGDLYAARQRYTQAAESFERLAEYENATRMRNFAARALMAIGDSTAAWDERRRGLAAAARWGDARLLEVGLSETVQDALNSAESDVARTAASAAYQIAPQPNRRRRVGMLVATAMVAADPTMKRVDLDHARQEALGISDPALRTSAIREIDAAEGIALRDTDPARSAELLSGAIDYQHAEAGGTLPQLYLQRARTLRAMERYEAAAADLQHAIGIVESRRAAIAGDELRALYLGSVRDIYDELVDVSIERGRTEDAFAVNERSRARASGADGEQGRWRREPVKDPARIRARNRARFTDVC
jgi:tetratricopeptide (TPR) repeat protein